MKVLSWNVQGLASKDTRDYLAHIIQKHNAEIVFLMETKVSESRAKILTQEYCYPNSRFVSTIGLSGGLVLLWKGGFPCDVL